MLTTAATIALLALGQTGAQPETKAADKPAGTTAESSAQLAPVTSVFEAAELTLVADGCTFTEGPLWREAKLFFCDLAGDAIYTVVPGGKKEVFRKPASRPAGLATDPQGRLLTAHFAGLVTRTEKDGTVATIAEKAGEEKLAKCNDLAVRPDGVIYFTDFGGRNSKSKGLFRIDAAGAVSSLDADYQAANGVALSPDHKTLYVNDYGKQLVIAYDVGADGGVSNRRVFADFSKETAEGRCDGIKVAPDGRVITTAPGGVWVLTPDGKRVTLLQHAEGASNVALGGEDGRTLFITRADCVWSARLK
jgi:gluconolactonase